MKPCAVGMVNCWVFNENVQYEILSFFALILLPLMILVRLAVLEIIFQKYKKLTNKKLAYLYLWIVALKEGSHDNSSQQEEEFNTSKVEK
tara:strand:+ start:314 stop:583 length:270 start_codon:yes stop_codon:yes gene_type:complete